MKHTDRLDVLLKARQCTLLGIGPMSKLCVDATIEIANELDIPLMLIASRRQIEAASHGGGYVNGWTTETFAEYVRTHDAKSNVLLARDHGGPWQNYSEVKGGLNLQEAMKSAKQSYETDIKSGFDMIHIDPSIDIHKRPSFEEVLERLFELYLHCVEYARSLGKEVFFEFGTDEQGEGLHDLEELEALTEEITDFCSKHRLPKPYFVVAQTGAKVKETKNVGVIADPGESGAVKAQLKKLVAICNRYGVRLKGHNGDYLSDDTLRWHPEIGIHALNVAPEFGVAETKALIKVCDDLGLKSERDQFLTLALNSRKWDKWLLADTKATDFDRAVIAGHYVFATPEFTKIKARIAFASRARGLDLDQYLKEAIKSSIMRYVSSLNLSHG
ncbi:tagatose-6-phosphate kinase [Candidatus Parcubacteria bacterium]|nr:MAG: tagatose-6-phosphate kinase [Candidatus Parcubacteria bacterium]